MNTRFNYLYRDECNYKTYYSYVLEGEMTDHMYKTIKNHCEDYEFFYADVVGLPWWNGDCWAELNGYELTRDSPDESRTVYDLVDRFVDPCCGL